MGTVDGRYDSLFSHFRYAQLILYLNAQPNARPLRPRTLLNVRPRLQEQTQKGLWSAFKGLRILTSIGV
jgi:hypothetical protein